MSTEWSGDSYSGSRGGEAGSSSGESGSLSKSPPFHPHGIPPLDLLIAATMTPPPSWRKENDATVNPLHCPDYASIRAATEDSSFGSDSEETNIRMASRLSYGEDQQTPRDENWSSGSRMPSYASDLALHPGKDTPPKDFVCPITGQVFDDPVTLETGQTYERRAIEEWLDRGNSTCPITRQGLQSTQLPRTNYVLKRLIANRKENNPRYPNSASPSPTPALDQDPTGKKSTQAVKSFCTTPSSSPTSVRSRANGGGGTLPVIRFAVTQLCTSDVLSESELAVLQIEQLWRKTNHVEDGITALLSTPQVVNGIVETLFNSVDLKVLNGAIFLLSELASREKGVVQLLTTVDSDVNSIVALFKKGLAEAVVLVYQLGSSCQRLIELDMVDSLITTVKRNDVDSCGMPLSPRTAAVLLLAEILNGDDARYASAAVQSLLSERVVESIVSSLQSDLVEEKISAVGILLRCIEEDGSCRNLIAAKAELGPLLDCFNLLNGQEQFQMITFLYELVKQNRRRFNDLLLQDIKEKGVLSMMHLLLNYLQTSLQDQTPIVAGLLLQLDLLSEPQKMSIYREEAIDALIACLKNSDFPNSQMGAADVILSLQGRFSLSGKSLGRAILLKRAGMNKSYRTIMRAEKMGHVLGSSKANGEEEKAANDWEKKMAFALATHEFGLLFEVLARGLENVQAELFTSCLVSATWLVHTLSFLPDTGLKGAARVCLLKQFVSVLKSAEDINDKALVMLALRSMMSDPEGLKDLMIQAKDVLKSLRDLKKDSALADDVLKLLSDGKETSRVLWNHNELCRFDCSIHGEVVSIICFKDKIYSGHSDGTIKVWNIRGNIVFQAYKIREHTKPVTCLDITSSGDKLYSGSTDRTIRVWSAAESDIRCIEVLDMKDQIQHLAVFGSIICYSPQGPGVKVLSRKAGTETLNSSKKVRCLSLVRGNLYCGCNDSSIQGLDLATSTMYTFQSGGKKFLGKAHSVHAIQVHNGMLYSVNTSLEGSTVKVWNISTFNLVGSFQCTMDVRTIAVTSELIYLGCKTGDIEVWCKEQLSKVETLHTGGSSRVQCMTVNPDGKMLAVGTSDGTIQAWGLP